MLASTRVRVVGAGAAGTGASIVIHDNGLTEVAPGSATVRIPRAARW
ncbi:hypothetical protein [Kocuria palustris]|nr:hypothetical protein [Kocuria palustris]